MLEFDGTYGGGLGSGFDVSGGVRVVPLYPFSMMDIGIYKRSSMPESTIPVKLVEVHFENAE